MTNVSVTHVYSPTRDQVDLALDRSLPVIELMEGRGWTGGRSGLCYLFLHERPDGELIVVERTFGNPDFSQHPYNDIGGSKARVTKRFEKPTHEIPLAERQENDTIYEGSVWNPIILSAHGASGYQAYYDRLFCHTVDANLMDIMGLNVDLGDPPAGFKIEGDFLVPT